MNIFAIEGDETTGEINWYESGRSQDNLRTVKMLLESTQLLSTALQLNGMPGPYKPNHANTLLLFGLLKALPIGALLWFMLLL